MITIETPGDCVSMRDTETGERCYLDSGVGFDVSIARTSCDAGDWIEGHAEVLEAFGEVEGMSRDRLNEWIEARANVSPEDLEWIG